MLNIYNLNQAPAYLGKLAQWHHKQWSYLYENETIEKRIENMQPYLNANFIPTTYIAIENELLGSASIIKSDMETKPQYTPWLASVYVDPPHRKKGIGTQLVKHVMQQASQHGINHMYLFTPDQQAFYQSLGWTLVEKTHYHGENVSIMSVKLVEQN